MTMRYGLAILAYLVPTFALGIVWHLVLFAEYYAALQIYRSGIIIPFGLLSMLIQAAIFAWAVQTRCLPAGAAPGCRAASSTPLRAACCHGASRRSPSPPRT